MQGPDFWLKLAHGVCLDDVLDKFDHGWGWIKKWITRSNCRKNLVYAPGATFLANSFCVYTLEATLCQVFLKLAQDVCLDDIWDKFFDGWGQVKK